MRGKKKKIIGDSAIAQGDPSRLTMIGLLLPLPLRREGDTYRSGGRPETGDVLDVEVEIDVDAERVVLFALFPFGSFPFALFFPFASPLAFTAFSGAGAAGVGSLRRGGNRVTLSPAGRLGLSPSWLRSRSV